MCMTTLYYGIVSPIHGQNFDNVCLGHLFTYRDFQGELTSAMHSNTCMSLLTDMHFTIPQAQLDWLIWVTLVSLQ